MFTRVIRPRLFLASTEPVEFVPEKEESSSITESAMNAVPIKITERTQIGKGSVGKLRNTGVVPGTLYGQKSAAVTVGLDPRDVIRVLRTNRGQNTALALEWDGNIPEGGDSTTIAVIRDYQVHPVKRKLLHVDLLRVQPDTSLVVTIPIKTSGKSVGEERGAKLVHVTRELKVRCRVDAIPDNIVVDVTPYGLGFTMYARDLDYPEGVEPAFKSNFPIFSISEPRVYEEETEEEAEGEGEGEGEEAAAENAES